MFSSSIVQIEPEAFQVFRGTKADSATERRQGSQVAVLVRNGNQHVSAVRLEPAVVSSPTRAMAA